MGSVLNSGFDFCGRRFTEQDIKLITEVTRNFSRLSLTELSNTVSELLEWKRPNGKLKYDESRALLQKLQASGIVSLPAMRKTAVCGARTIVHSASSDARDRLEGAIGGYLPLKLRLVDDRSLSSLWNQFIDRYHYLKRRVPFGANLRYLVESEQAPGRYLACLLFTSPAWTMAPRDAWIGWTDRQRKRCLQYVVSNGRFLVLPWVSLRGLGSKTLSLAAQQLPEDWERCYGYRPMLLETLVDSSRYKGTVYRASNWIYLGKTQGRGRMDRDHSAQDQAIKDIYVFPLCRNVQRHLCEARPPQATL